MPQDFKEVEDYFSRRVGGGVFADIQPVNLFAGAEPELLDEILITGRNLVGGINVDPVVPKGLSPTAVEGIFGIASRFLNPLLMLVTPGNMGPRGTGELEPDMVIDNTRDPLPLLDEVVINPPRPPSTPPPDFAFPQQPPNWWDMFQVNDTIYPPQPFFPVGPRDDRRDFEDRPGAVPDSPAGSPQPASRPNPTGNPFTQPSPLPTPGVPAPDLFPDPFTLPVPDPFGTPGDEPTPYGSPSPVPGPGAFPDPDAFPDPFGDPLDFPAPQRDPVPTPTPRPRTPTPFPGPDGFFDPHEPTFQPGPDSDPDLNPFPDPFTPTPPKEADTCDCTKEPKKKKKKKSEPRTVCYKGTYRQLKKGIIYNRGAEVPCEAKAATKSKVTRVPRDLGDLANIIFGP